MKKAKIIHLTEREDMELKILAARLGVSQKKVIEMAIVYFIRENKDEESYLDRQ
jgi:hypothetical protein